MYIQSFYCAVKYTLYNIRCTIYAVQYTLYNIPNIRGIIILIDGIDTDRLYIIMGIRRTIFNIL